MIKYNLIFFGSPKNSADLLRVLNEDARFTILAAVTQPDRPAGRGQKTPRPTPVAHYAASHNIAILKPERDPNKKHLFKEPNRLKELISKGGGNFAHTIDLLLAYEFGQLIPNEILSLALRGGLNIHFSLLPAYRGPAPLPYQILNNESHTGITVIKMSDQFDRGEIIYQEAHNIPPDATTVSLHKTLSARVLGLIPNLLANYLSTGKTTSDVEFKKLPMLKEKPSYAPHLKRSHGYIEWKDFKKAVLGNDPKKAEDIERRIRAFTPWPGVWTRIKDSRLKILSGNLQNGTLVPQTVQLSGKKPQPWPEIKQAVEL